MFRSTSKDKREGLYSRNWAFISASMQKQLAQATIFTAGTGLGSVIATLAARTGFQRFILADGDVVEVSNLNRQVFTRKQLGVNKASAVKKIVGDIVPSASVEVVPRFIDSALAARYIARADVVVNTIDLTNPAFLGVNRVARAQNKPVLFPINLGWGGAVLVFTPDAISLDEFIGGDSHTTLQGALAADGGDEATMATRLVRRILEEVPGGVPLYLSDTLARYSERTNDSWPFDPQLGVATHLTAAMTVRAAVALVTGEPLRVAPDIIWADTYVSSSSLASEPAALGQASPELAMFEGAARETPVADQMMEATESKEAEESKAEEPGKAVVVDPADMALEGAEDSEMVAERLVE